MLPVWKLGEEEGWEVGEEVEGREVGISDGWHEGRLDGCDVG